MAQWWIDEYFRWRGYPERLAYLIDERLSRLEERVEKGERREPERPTRFCAPEEDDGPTSLPAPDDASLPTTEQVRGLWAEPAPEAEGPCNCWYRVDNGDWYRNEPGNRGEGEEQAFCFEHLTVCDDHGQKRRLHDHPAPALTGEQGETLRGLRDYCQLAMEQCPDEDGSLHLCTACVQWQRRIYALVAALEAE